MLLFKLDYVFGRLISAEYGNSHVTKMVPQKIRDEIVSTWNRNGKISAMK